VYNDIKILFLSKYLNPSGVTVFMFNLGKKLIENGYSVGIATGKETGEHSYSLKKFREAGFETFEIPFPGKGYGVSNILRLSKSILKYLEIIREYKPDLIHVHWRITSLFAELSYKLFGIPYIVTLHLEGIPNNRISKLLSFWGEYAIAISRETYDYLHSAFNLPLSKIKLIYNGVDEDYFYPPNENDRIDAKRKFGISLDDKVVCLIGRFSKVKGHDLLIKAASLLKERNVKPIFILAGSGDESWIRAMIEEYELQDQFISTGFLDSRDVLWASDILVLPSRKEGFPLVVVEAMLCGVPTIRTPAAGAYDQIEDGINGYIIPFEDEKSLADRIQLLIEDDELRRKISKKAFEKAKQVFTLREMVSNYIKVYEDVLSKKKKIYRYMES